MIDLKTQTMLGVLENQRNQALNAIAQLAGENAELKEALRVANEQIAKQQKPKK